ncbi:MAG: MarR family transcriptional regulator [Clostridia bacterium]|nr:MarR family transcriptional regulator [Clostridia bacterium]
MEIHDSLGYLLNTSARMIKRKMDACLEKYTITTSQWAVLKLLDTKEVLTQAQVAEGLRGDRATMGSVIQRLQEKKLIDKVLDTKDRRAYLVCLTPVAKEMIKDIEKMAQDVFAEALKGFEESDIEVLYRSIRRIIANLSEEENV